MKHKNLNMTVFKEEKDTFLLIIYAEDFALCKKKARNAEV